MPVRWPNKPRLLGTQVPRIDGPELATGHARYTADIKRVVLLHALILRSPHAHARIKALDTTAAEKLPDVAGVHVIAPVGTELLHAGQEIVALAADTEDHARDALRVIKVEYEILEHCVKEEDALRARKNTFPGADGNVRPGGEAVTNNFAKAFVGLETVTGEYGVPVICHQCLEPHGLIAEWDRDGGLTVWASTQAVTGTAASLATHFKLPPHKVTCITHYMGGGFGSKFGPDIQGIVAAELARKIGAPVKLMFDRKEEVTEGGSRPSAYGTVKLGGTKDGKLVAYEVDCHGSPGVGMGSTVNFGLLPYVYTIPNVKKRHRVVRLNTGAVRAMRAPGHPQNCVLTEWAIDDFCARLGLNPLEVRLKNLPANMPGPPQAWNSIRHDVYTTELKLAAAEVDWDRKWHPPGKGPGKGPIKHGLGMALHTWGGAGFASNDTRVSISSNGSVLVESSTQDLGTGQRTVLAIVVAEALGLEVKDVTVRIGESPLGRSGGSGGSTTCASQAPAALNAAEAARAALFGRIAPHLGAKAEDLAVLAGKIVDQSSKKSWSWKEACSKIGTDPVQGQGDWIVGLSGSGVGGVQIAEVLVDTETGTVRCTRVVAVQDCGLIVNKLACESQVAGGVIMGVSTALFEERIMDRVTGRQVNPDMEFYKLAGIQDVPRIVVKMIDMPQRGVIGIGEPPIISTCAAIGNAIANAIGVRVPFAPFTPDRVLAALATLAAR